VGSRRKKRSRLNAENVLLAVEIGAIFLFVAAGIALWQTRQDVNEAYRDLQRSDPRVLPTLIAAANPGMLPDSLAHTGQDRGPAAAPPLPTPFPTSTPNALVVAAKPLAAIDEIEDAEREVEQDVNAQWGTTVVMEKRVAEHDQPRRLQIPSIGVNSFVFQDYGEDWMKLGVVQIAGPAAPGEPGNLVLAAHDDIYGEVFRDLDRLQPGDEISLLGDSESYVYRVRESLIVDPDDVWVTLPTSTPTLTLVSCYPYLINTHRIVVFADLAQ
jgi:sortase A